jgi:hypothetical protein
MTSPTASDQKQRGGSLSRWIVVLGVVCLGIAAALAAYDAMKPEAETAPVAAQATESGDATEAPAAPVATQKVPVYRLECGTDADGKAVVLGRSYSRPAMEALMRKTAAEAKVVTPGVCVIKESIAVVPAGGVTPKRPRHAAAQGPRLTRP